ncbi:MAG: FAD-dependent oxidoreductase [Alphaproteobacteria bacterium]|nr:FAD-dependent oxidoreductase [Alphaproteobacteria bacterium]
MAISVAIVGSGPAGFYSAEALLKSGANVAIDIIDCLPTPYGLIRSGVAPDHAKTKNVARAYEKIALDERVRFFGNVEIGRDIAVSAMRDLYDVVVLAVGASRDRDLGIPGSELEGVVGVAGFVGWYNGHPDFRDLAPPLDTENVVVIGIGNVAVDVARVLTKTPAEMAGTDIADYASTVIFGSPIRAVHMAGRRGPLEARFTNVELREMGRLEDCAPIVDPKALPKEVTGEHSERDRRLIERNLATLREFVSIEPGKRSKRVHFDFFSNPVEILGNTNVEAVKFERTIVENGRAVGTGKFFEIPCGLVIPAIGYYSQAIEGVPFDERAGRAANKDGFIDDGFYCVGWIKRGPSGVIGSNKPDGTRAAELILESFPRGDKPGRRAFEALLAEKNIRAVSFADWQKIDAAEIANAGPGAPRRKFTRIADMLTVLEEG